jgi:hypothetical protein
MMLCGVVHSHQYPSSTMKMEAAANYKTVVIIYKITQYQILEDLNLKVSSFINYYYYYYLWGGTESLGICSSP